ncbi:MAG: DNA polymerase Y family protein [Pseudomonadota bacterium]
MAAKATHRRARRILGVFLPMLAIELHARRAGGEAALTTPFVLYERAENALRLVHANRFAQAAGLYPGQPLAEARALVPGLAAASAAPAADAVDFDRLAQGFLRYGPRVGVFGFGRICVEIAGSAHLFGGEAGVLSDLRARLLHLRFAARAAIADTPAAALAVAAYGVDDAEKGGRNKASANVSVSPLSSGPRGGRNPGWRGELVAAPGRGAPATSSAFAARIVPSGAVDMALDPLPVAVLDLDPNTVQLLRTLGLKTIGATRRQPRAALVKRFGKAFAARLDAACGAVFESLSPIAEPTDYSAFARTASPVMTIDAALEGARGLVADLAEKLERDDLGARRLALHLFRLDNTSHVERVDFGAPTRAPETILRLFRLKFEKGARPVDPGFGFDAFRLTAERVAPMAATQRSAIRVSKNASFLDEEAQDVRAALSRLADRLSAALGAGEVFFYAPRDTHVPERAAREAPALGAETIRTARSAWPAAVSPAGVPYRPLFLSPKPEPLQVTALAPDGPPARFIWRRVAYRVVRAAGPERLLGEWRLGEEHMRDYYRVEDACGRRFWIFREGEMGAGDMTWRLAGAFA